MMISPMIHRLIRRNDLARLIAEIGRIDSTRAQAAANALEAGEVDALLDSPVALDAVRGQGGGPAPLPLTLLWYIPVRATLLSWGETDIELADYAATLPVAFLTSRAVRRVARGEMALTAWTQAIEAVPGGTIARAEQAAYCGALALFWAGCFPESVTFKGGSGMLRAYGDFAAGALDLAARRLGNSQPRLAQLYARASARAAVVRDALGEVRVDYLGSEAHTPEGRLQRFLSRLTPEETGDAVN